MFREGPWKIIYHHGHEKPQLFNLVEDPEEMHDRGDDPTCAAICQRCCSVCMGWDGEPRGPALAQVEERRRAVFAKAKAHAMSTADYWDMPPGANVFPMK